MPYQYRPSKDFGRSAIPPSCKAIQQRKLLSILHKKLHRCSIKGNQSIWPIYRPVIQSNRPRSGAESHSYSAKKPCILYIQASIFQAWPSSHVATFIPHRKGFIHQRSTISRNPLTSQCPYYCFATNWLRSVLLTVNWPTHFRIVELKFFSCQRYRLAVCVSVESRRYYFCTSWQTAMREMSSTKIIFLVCEGENAPLFISRVRVFRPAVSSKSTCNCDYQIDQRVRALLFFPSCVYKQNERVFLLQPLRVEPNDWNRSLDVLFYFFVLSKKKIRHTRPCCLPHTYHSRLSVSGEIKGIKMDGKSQSRTIP